MTIASVTMGAGSLLAKLSGKYWRNIVPAYITTAIRNAVSKLHGRSIGRDAIAAVMIKYKAII